MKSIILKVISTLGVILLLGIPWLRVWINYERAIWEYLFYILAIILFVILIIKIWKDVKSKKLNIATFILLIFLVLDMVYYENISMKIEPLIHLHNKYDIKYSDMKVIDAEKSNNPIVGTYQPRETVIKIGNSYISTYYESWYTASYNDRYTDKIQEWKDDYIVAEQISQVLTKYTNNYKYSKEYDWYSYDILMQKDDSYKMSDVIEELNMLFKKLGQIEEYDYTITFVDNNKFSSAINKENKVIALATHVAEIKNYTTIDDYYDKNKFLLKEKLTYKQREIIEEHNFDGYNFEYHIGDEYVQIWGYKYEF